MLFHLKHVTARAVFFLCAAFVCADGPRASGATLTGSFSGIAQGSNVNLTAVGVLDWVHWGLYTDTSIDRKANVLPSISDFSVVGNTNGLLTVYQYADNFNGYTWSDGTFDAAVTNTPTGVWAYDLPNFGSGFEFTVPADTTQRTLQVFVGVFHGRGSVHAWLSDDSAAGYSNSALANLQGNGPGGVYTLTYAAASAEQTLHVQWTLALGTAPDANVTLQAAALTSSGANNPPFAALARPAPYSSFAAPANLMLVAAAADADGSISQVEFFEGTHKLGQATSAPYSLDWTGVPKGHYFVCAKATDNQGATSECRPVEIFVFSSDGALSGVVAQPPAGVNLTTEGATDWIHWGYTNADSINRKAGIAPQFSTFTKIGPDPVEGFSDPRYSPRYSWTDGSPTAAVFDTQTGILSKGVTNGFALSVPAALNARTLKVYVGLYGAQGSFLAYLSDFSAAAYADSSLSSVYGNVYAVYTLSFAAASAEQTLNLRYFSRNAFDFDYGEVRLQAATLVGGPVISNLPVTLLHPTMLGTDFCFSFASQTGCTYTAQFTPSLNPTHWQDFTNLPGNGSVITITNQAGSATSRYYRVRTD